MQNYYTPRWQVRRAISEWRRGNLCDTSVTYSIYYGNEGTPSVGKRLGPLRHHEKLTSLLDSNFNVFPIFICRWEIQTLTQDLPAVRIRYDKKRCTLPDFTPGIGKYNYVKSRGTTFKGGNFQNVASTKPKARNLFGYNCRQLCMLRS